MKDLIISALAVCLFAGPIAADPPQVVSASAQRQGATWTIAVTLTHPDTGWDHYASGWKVLAPDGTELGYRELTHPHVDEQPFTRSLSGVIIADGIRHVFIQTRCTLDGWASSKFQLDLPN